MRHTPDVTHPNADSFPSGLSGPALRALAHAGIRTMAQLAQHTESEVASLHGMGPKGIRVLREGLQLERRHFRQE
jgi:predicted RecB family nuclease